MSKTDHSRLCLRRSKSQATLVSTDRHSKFCLRSRAKRVQNRYYILIANLREKPIRRQDYFTWRLPPEIRVLIYRLVLSFEAPIRLERDPRRVLKTKLAGILLVNRLVHIEALAVLHEVNTIVISREELCQFPTNKTPQLTCRLELVQRLYIRNLTASSRCAARMSYSWLAAYLPCQNCRGSLLGLIHTLRLQPRLKEVFIDYHGYHYAVAALMEPYEESEDLHNHIRLICTGVAKYTLTGDWLRGIKFELQDVPLSEIWSLVMALPSPRQFRPYYRAHRAMMNDARWLETRVERKALGTLMIRILLLMCIHDSHHLPIRFASIWPDEIPMDFRMVESDLIDQPDLLHELNVRILAYLEEGPLTTQDLVVRRE